MDRGSPSFSPSLSGYASSYPGACMCTRTHSYTHVHAHGRTPWYMHTCVCMHTHTDHTHAHTSAHTNVCTHKCMYTNMLSCTHTQVHTFMHTGTHSLLWQEGLTCIAPCLSHCSRFLTAPRASALGPCPVHVLQPTAHPEAC